MTKKEVDRDKETEKEGEKESHDEVFKVEIRKQVNDNKVLLTL